MKHSTQLRVQAIYYKLFILGFVLLFVACKNGASKEKKNEATTDDIVKVEEIYWNVKAIQPDGKSLDIKAFNDQEKAFDVKGIQNSDQDNLIDIKAIVDGNNLPVKILVSKDQFTPVVAITPKGDAYKLQAVTPEGEKLQVIGVVRFGNIVIMKAMTKKGKFYGVKAISPNGKLNDVKGIKINPQDREMSSRGHEIYAHVKAMHPSANEDEFELPKKNVAKADYKSDFKRIIWNIEAVTTDGKNLDVKAFDADGNAFDVKATQDSKQHSFMNIKAFVNEEELPVKIMHSEEGHAPIKAIGSDGSIYDIKAIADGGAKLDVKGISRSGNIINVKAVNENGELYGVKAFAPDGKLNAVKGVKIFQRDIEMKLRGNPVYAHLKAIVQ
ncbi:DUF7486 family protein [Cognatitamlana onchidii]|uniref:DUF7486 family protein n=1 Tax=Cognatitamlana onchidii TaxID=2562860 RepID=UPI0010A615D8|nr:hypothetical protein [Algibacter onchidii]